MENNTKTHNNELKFSALDLIEKYVTFQKNVPDRSKWREEAFEDHPPQKVLLHPLARFRQLNALLKAYKIYCDLTEFRNGMFLVGDDTNECKQAILSSMLAIDGKFKENNYNYEFLRKRIDQHIRNNSRAGKSRSKNSDRSLSFLFQMLLKYKVSIENSFQKSSFDHIMTSSCPITLFSYQYASYFDKAIRKATRSDMEDIDNLLSVLISPKQKTFSRKELVEQYGYPDQTLREMECNKFDYF